ncbi:MAG: DUF502 domain-containing protein [Bacteroidales bacterium]|nr:DUF502 domain-containing protein [Bacteroidales bacterium]MCF8388877.1 DUF502 domain-containing protein [Bacteroidales bacterium]MCF8399204.1 DUF502 domain-containing protein [Bacteroidales bacterium]
MKSKSFGKQIGRYFLQGLLYLAPVSITLYIIYISFVYVDSLLDKYIADLLGVTIPGLGILVIFVGLTLIGFLGSSILFRPIVRYFDRLISRAPLIKIIYTSLKDIFSAFVGQKKRFTEPVLIKINRETDLHKIGFVTNRDLSLLGIGGEKVAVYLPHSYNFSGNLFVVPVENIVKLNAKSADVMKFIISAGITDIESKEQK